MKVLKQSIKKGITLTLILALMSTLLIGCGKEETSNKKETPVEKTTSEEGITQAEEKEEITLEVYLSHTDVAEVNEAIEAFKQEDRFSHITLNVADEMADYDTKISVMIASGTQVDIMSLENPIKMHNWASAGTLLPIDPYLDELGLVYSNYFGEAGAKATQVNDETYMIPYAQTKWLLAYNKDLFDAAGVEYPSATEPMTMEEYRELAKQLTRGQGEDKIYGALQLTWPQFWYAPAILELGGGEAFYNEEGLSNIENPAFANALQTNYNMQHVDGSVPTYAEAKISQLKAISFMNGKYGMSLLASWALSWFGNEEQYPRDWRVGLAPMPIVNEESGKQTFGVLGGFGVPRSSAHPKEATEVALYLSEKVAEFTRGEIPAYQQYEREDLVDAILANFGEDDNVTQEYIEAILLDPEIVSVSEKITGVKASQYETVMNEEVEKYFVQEQDLETTISNIKKRADELILMD